MEWGKKGSRHGHRPRRGFLNEGEAAGRADRHGGEQPGKAVVTRGSSPVPALSPLLAAEGWTPDPGVLTGPCCPSHRVQTTPINAAPSACPREAAPRAPGNAHFHLRAHTAPRQGPADTPCLSAWGPGPCTRAALSPCPWCRCRHRLPPRVPATPVHASSARARFLGLGPTRRRFWEGCGARATYSRWSRGPARRPSPRTVVPASGSATCPGGGYLRALTCGRR